MKSYVARTKRRLEKHIVKPILLKLLDEFDEDTSYRWKVLDAIEDINIYMNWLIAKKTMKKDKRYYNRKGHEF